MGKPKLKSAGRYKYFNRGNRCYGIPVSKLCLIFVRGIRSWTEPQLWKFLNEKFNGLMNSIISVKYTNNFGDTFFRIKVKLTLKQSKKFCKDLEKSNSLITASCIKVRNITTKRSFSDIKNGLLCMKSSFRHSNIASTSNVITSTSSSPSQSSPNIPSNPEFNHQNISFCVSWNTNGWNYIKRDGIEYFNYIFRPLFLCFQETGNGSKLNDDIFCKVTVRNYRYFRKRAVKSNHGMRGLYLGYHRSCQASLEYNDFNYILSLCTYSLWNHSKCSIGNVYVPQKKYSLERKIAITEIASWLNTHSDNAAILMGDFNCSTDKLKKFLSSFRGWSVLHINGSNISWSRGHLETDIDHAIVNNKMLEKISSAIFIDKFEPVSDHKPLLIHCNAMSSNDIFTLPKNYVRWDRNQCKVVKDLIFNNNRFSILNNEILNRTDLSSDELVEKFTASVNCIADDLNITSVPSAPKKLIEISKSILYLQRKKMSLYNSIRKKDPNRTAKEFIELVNHYLRVCKSVHKKSNDFRKKEYQHWIEIGCKQAIQNNGKKMWNWIKKSANTGKIISTNNQPIKDKYGNLVSSTEDQLNVFHNHFKKLASDPKGQSLSNDYWENSYIPKNFSETNHEDWDINQEISLEEIKEAIFSTPNFKTSDPYDIFI